MHNFSESTLVEQPGIGLFAQLGYETAHTFSETFGKNGTLGRETNTEVVLVQRLRAAIERLNPGLAREHTCSRGGTYCCTSSLQKNAPCERDHPLLSSEPLFTLRSKAHIARSSSKSKGVAYAVKRPPSN